MYPVRTNPALRRRDPMLPTANPALRRRNPVLR
jgi:hypothetical protein